MQNNSMRPTTIPPIWRKILSKAKNIHKNEAISKQDALHQAISEVERYI